MIRFQFENLSPSMCFALSWLIDQGGATSYTQLIAGAGGAAKVEGRLVTRSTVNGLLSRGYLEESYDLRGWVQVGPWTVKAARLASAVNPPVNPPVEPVMQVRAEALAHREHAQRTADAIREAWNARNPT